MGGPGPLHRAALAAACWMCSALTAGAEHLSFGVLAFRGEQTARTRWQPTVDYLSEVLDGHEITLVPVTLEGARAALDTGTLDLLFTNPGHYRAMAARYRLSPLATLASDRPGRPRTGNRYGAVIFARAGRDGIHHLSDLHGKSFAAVAAEACGGFRIAAYTLRQDDKAYRGAMRNIQNHINAVGAENMEIKVVLHGNGVGLLMSALKNRQVEMDVTNLKTQNVAFQVCNHTLTGRNIDYHDQLFEVCEDDIVPSGVAELARLQQMGYTYIKP